MPVFLATDKETVGTQATVNADALKPLAIERRVYADPFEAYLPYHVAELGEVPAFTPLGDNHHLMRLTASSHDERGILTKKPEEVDRLNQHLYQKIESRRAGLEFVNCDLQVGAETLIISFGVTARSTQDAVVLARAKGLKVSQVTVHSLSPVPQNKLSRALATHRRVPVPELNHGQYRLEIERLAASSDSLQVVGFNRVDGELITPDQILDAI